MTTRRPRRLAAWRIVRETDGEVWYLALPLLNGGDAWTDDARLAAPYFTRSEASTSLRFFRPHLLGKARIVPVWL